MHPDHQTDIQFTSRSRLENSIHRLLGLLRGISLDLKFNERELYFLEGISLDLKINKREVLFLSSWLSDHESLEGCHPYNEIVPILRGMLEDGVVSEEERKDLIWVCEGLCSNNFYDAIAAGLQQLHGLLAGVLADDVLTANELRGIQAWMEDNQQLSKRWPYDEIESLIISVMADGKIDEEEHNALTTFFAQFAEVLDGKPSTDPCIPIDSTVNGVCAYKPEIAFQGSRFCLTGESSNYSRDVFEEKIKALGGEVVDSVSGKLNYLVIGGDGNPCWSYACYGRKVEEAIALRKAGAEILIVHEFDLYDAIEVEC
jgi:hypothetical protein